ncbi:hypothetical protein TrRE_jg2444 [Triparma retinervis]|uniref:Uncharacterized protein n=1 Tax=Triparma retinervis TaxID=2557542 RepID=A0A9W6Z6A7_9STRA|nr:hypothetical protein TrRE_jg2444 [Triparma retinervis]
MDQKAGSSGSVAPSMASTIRSLSVSLYQNTMIAQLTATITLKERAIRQAQERFGVEVYPLMSPVWKGEEVEKLLRTKKQFVEKKETELRVMRQELAEIRKRKKEGSSIAAGQGGEKADSTDGGMSYMTNGISLATDEAVKALRRLGDAFQERQQGRECPRKWGGGEREPGVGKRHENGRQEKAQD